MGILYVCPRWLTRVASLVQEKDAAPAAEMRRKASLDCAIWRHEASMGSGGKASKSHSVPDLRSLARLVLEQQQILREQLVLLTRNMASDCVRLTWASWVSVPSS